MINLYATVEGSAFDGDPSPSAMQLGPFSPEEGFEDDIYGAEDALRENLEAEGYIVACVWGVEA